jgi:hypothetical protein
MPPECSLWSCRWLVNDDADDLSRPDRSHYVIDLMPDFVSLRDNASGEIRHIEVVQIWCDPKFPDAHRDPALRRWLERRARKGVAALIRFNEHDAVTVFAPPFDAHGQWHEISSASATATFTRTHTFAEIVTALGGQGA